MQKNFFEFKKTWGLTPFVQVAIIVFVFILTVSHGYIEFQKTGLTQWGFPVSGFIYFAPIYEEIIFRGFILMALLKYTNVNKAIIYSSLLFGVWHFRNIFFMDLSDLVYQIAYTSLFFGPLLAYIAIKTKTIWIGVILHCLNNFLAPISWLIIGYLLKIV